MLVSANIFQPLISVFQSVITFFHDNVGLGWGWSIILLTVCVRLLLAPLMVKSFHGMRRMQAHAPEIKAIQQKYKNDRERQQQETMKFYKENKVNPFASCLPMVLQLPVMVSLFYMLRKNLRTDICGHIQTAFQHAYATANKISFKAAGGQTTYCTDPKYDHGQVHNAGFLFIHDITNNATGATLVLLVVLYAGTQFATSLITMSPTMDKTQRRMMMFLPVLFVPVILHFPAGLLVYWITTNTWTLGQQATFRLIFGPVPVSSGAVALEQVREDAEDAEEGVAGRLKGLLGGRRDDGDDNALKVSNNGPKRQPSGPPPRSPRKKKKRSGRRR